MTLPSDLRAMIEHEIQAVTLSSLTEASQELSERYRDAAGRGRRITTDAQRLAYLVARMPATYGAVHAVLSELHERIPTVSPQSVLDLGAGPGTASWAAADFFTDLKSITLVEEDASFVSLGKRMSERSSLPVMAKASWILADITQGSSWAPHDLVLLSYSIGEMPPEKVMHLLERCWEATTEALIIVEPGTPRGYQAILKAREALIGMNAHIIAPCPHMNRCPLQDTSQWCHFSCRIERSSVHRQAKSASLGYEDEKYSYLIATKKPVAAASARVIAMPLKRSGHVHLELCTATGIHKTVITKKNPEDYRRAKKSDWGSSW